MYFVCVCGYIICTMLKGNRLEYNNNHNHKLLLVQNSLASIINI